ncbi:hypothetical protein CLAFUW4_05418 [Fulvia fulva]|uniref:Uncharacterized protein n=1 Tax=Passalora fulva TaxID=5499 RepID=A0A9Q8LHG7_PASFU|nr:uncharacterized protein CLAFUR5_05565 [Fulvia fulva]KAK4624328.1 hypothetical protein CLAFUR4_05412 [Fulvia fulva]KAK4625254.1 hypothetical protein CLAFUR0_05420 [Fulvia fulva]UJO17244.1 hypothetical protein CLAFUR5_05565 [Fulvia fulva]WPV15316.1 hypothetical protein CLAFUW4_05418 [Fulvia fulva]WPV29809.1 hypothetical protein CLAFUW7_05416 [Fulvia fulva]
MSTSSAPAKKKKVCYIIEKLSAETRINIYKHIFGSDSHASFAPLDSSEGVATSDSPTAIPTAIFAVNRQLHDEALETFFNNKVIQVTFSQLEDLLQQTSFQAFVRDIEVMACDQAHEARAVQNVLIKVQGLPRLRSITILSDYLAFTGAPDKHVTVRQWTSAVGLGIPTCTDIGRYQLHGAYSKVQFHHSKILAMWPNVRTTPDDYDALGEAEEIQHHWSIAEYVSNLMAWSSHSSLRLWVGLYESAKAHAASEDAADLDDNEALHKGMSFGSWLRIITHRRPDVPFTLRGQDSAVPLRDLGAQHDPITLESATELLAMNIATYTKTGDLEYGPGDEYTKPRWSELGEKSEGEIKAEWYPIAMRALEEQRFVKDPLDQHRMWEIDTVRKMILSNEGWTNAFGGTDKIDSATKPVLQQIMYLILATGGVEISDEASQESESWSKALLVKYLRHCLPDTESSDWDDVELKTLRQVFFLALALMLVSSRQKAGAGAAGGLNNTEDISSDSKDKTSTEDQQAETGGEDAENRIQKTDDTKAVQEEDSDISQYFLAKAEPALIAAMQLQFEDKFLDEDEGTTATTMDS